MVEKIVCAECHFVFDQPDGEDRALCPQCGATLYKHYTSIPLSPNTETAKPKISDLPRARRVVKTETDDRPRARRVSKAEDDETPRRRRQSDDSPSRRRRDSRDEILPRRRRERYDDEPMDPPLWNPPLSLYLGIGMFFLCLLGGLGYVVVSHLRTPGQPPAIAVAPPPFPRGQFVPPVVNPAPRELPVPEFMNPPEQELGVRVENGQLVPEPRGIEPAPPGRVPARPGQAPVPAPDQFRLPDIEVPSIRPPAPAPNPRPALPPNAVPLPPRPEPPGAGPGEPQSAPPAPSSWPNPIKFPPVNPLPIVANHDVKEMRTMNLPGKVTSLCVGGGGKYLCFHFEKLRQIGIFDMTTAKFAKYIPVTSERIRMAAGMDRLVVYESTADQFVHWNLRSIEKESTKPKATKKIVGKMLMGYASNGPLIILTNPDEQLFLKPRFGFCDPLVMRVFDMGIRSNRVQRLFSPSAQISADGKLFIASGGTEEDDYMFYHMGETMIGRTVIIPMHYAVRLSADGRYVYTQHGFLPAAEKSTLASRDDLNSYLVEPALQSGIVVRVFPDKKQDKPDMFQKIDYDLPADLKFYRDGETTPFATWTKQTVPIPAIYNPLLSDHITHRYFLSTDSKLFAMLSVSNDKLFLRRFDPAEKP